MRRTAPLVTSAAVACLLVAGCGDAGPDAATATSGDAVEVVASFYPLQWITELVGSDRVAVTSLTPPGAEPHDLELSPSDVATVAEGDLVVYLSGFQPAVDDAVAEATGATFDAADHARMTLAAAGDEAAHPEEDGDHAHEGDGGKDPHFWLDPLRLADVSDAVADELATLDAEHAEEFRANAAALRTDLEQLDADFTEGLASCTSKELVTSHSAFGYLAERYGLTQLGISGLSPEDEPSPADLAAATDFVREHGVTTIYFETLVSPTIAETIAAETGAETAVLDPIEGLTDDSAGEDYLEVMRSNLASLRSGQTCP